MPKINDPFLGPAMFDLRGKQSVRATFKISQKAIDSIGLVAIHMGIKQKSLFDHIIEDMTALSDLAKTIRIRQFKKIDRKQKTFVLSRRTIEALGSISETYDMPRDALVEYSVKKLESVIMAEKLRHEERKKLQQQMTAYFLTGEALYKHAIGVLSEDDPFCRHFEKTVTTSRKTTQAINEFLEKSKVLENF
ncbi:MAG: hypothetical protein GY710_07360 [Desulfobacteraceae bacterium]|nr:hypothetical protein [Desulfobacteraceae bacterium]